MILNLLEVNKMSKLHSKFSIGATKYWELIINISK